jgi:hypothetical protein
MRSRADTSSMKAEGMPAAARVPTPRLDALLPGSSFASVRPALFSTSRPDDRGPRCQAPGVDVRCDVRC